MRPSTRPPTHPSRSGHDTGQGESRSTVVRMGNDTIIREQLYRNRLCATHNRKAHLCPAPRCHVSPGEGMPIRSMCPACSAKDRRSHQTRDARARPTLSNTPDTLSRIAVADSEMPRQIKTPDAGMTLTSRWIPELNRQNRKKITLNECQGVRTVHLVKEIKV